MAIQTTTFKGARYVVKFHDPIEWADTESYEAIEAVQHEAFTYISKQPVPAGVQISNEDFWLLWADPNAQMEQLRQLVEEQATVISQWGDELQAEIENVEKARAFETVADMKQGNNLVNGAICHTNGFHVKEDGGAAWYEISDTGTPNEMDVISCGNLFAKLIVTNGIVTPEMFGAYGNGTNDDTDSIKLACSNGNEVNFSSGKTYKVTEVVNIEKPITLNGNSAVIKHDNVSAFLITAGISNVSFNDISFESAFNIGSSDTSNYAIGTSAVNAASEYETTNITVKSCSFSKSVFGIVLNNVRTALIQNCIFGETYFKPQDSAGGYSILLESSKDVTIDNCHFTQGNYSRHDIYVSLLRTKTEHIACRNVLISNCVFDHSNKEQIGSSVSEAYYSQNTSAIAVRICRGITIENCELIKGTGLVSLNDIDKEEFANECISGAFVENCRLIDPVYIENEPSETRYGINFISSDTNASNKSDIHINNVSLIFIDSALDVRYALLMVTGASAFIENVVINTRVNINTVSKLIMNNIGILRSGAIHYNSEIRTLTNGSIRNVYSADNGDYSYIVADGTMKIDANMFDELGEFSFSNTGAISNLAKAHVRVSSTFDNGTISIIFTDLSTKPFVVDYTPIIKAKILLMETTSGIAANEIRFSQYDTDGAKVTDSVACRIKL